MLTKRAAADAAKAAHGSAMAKRETEGRDADAVLSRRAIAEKKIEETEVAQQGLGAITSVDLRTSSEALQGLSATAVWRRIEQISKELSALGHINKKALDQCAPLPPPTRAAPPAAACAHSCPPPSASLPRCGARSPPSLGLPPFGLPTLTQSLHPR